MRVRKHFNSTSRRALWAGWAVSLIVHALALAFGRFSSELPVPKAPSVRVLDIAIPEEEPVMEIVELDGYALGTEETPARSEILGRPAPSESQSEFTTPGTLDESSRVLASAAIHSPYPIVPKPELRPMTVETSFAPMHALASEGNHLAKAESGSEDGDGPGGGGIRISVGTGQHCQLCHDRDQPSATRQQRRPLAPAGPGRHPHEDQP